MRLTLLLMTMSLSGCAAGLATSPPIDTSCDWVRPIWLHADDQLTTRTARQILGHNEAWERVCGDITR